jgi:hypothetical protein
MLAKEETRSDPFRNCYFITNRKACMGSLQLIMHQPFATEKKF